MRPLLQWTQESSAEDELQVVRSAVGAGDDSWAEPIELGDDETVVK